MPANAIYEYVCLGCGRNFGLASTGEDTDPLDGARCSECGSTEIVSRY